MKSLISRYDQAAAAASLDQVGDQLYAGGPTMSEPTEVQRRFVAFVTGLADHAEKSLSADTPAILSSAMALLRRSRPMLIEGIARVDDAKILGFLSMLRDDINAVLVGDALSTPVVVAEPAVVTPEDPVADTDAHDEHSAADSADQPGPDQSPGNP